MPSLKNILIINGISSALTGLSLIALPKFISDLFNVYQPTVFVGVGIFLLVFASIVLAEAFSSRLRPPRIHFIIALDVLWVLTSIITASWMINILSMIGLLIIIAVAVWVAAMAYLQSKGLKENENLNPVA